MTPEPQVAVPKIVPPQPEPTKVVNQLNSLNDADDNNENQGFVSDDGAQEYYDEEHDEEEQPPAPEPESVDRNPIIRIHPSKRIQDTILQMPDY